MANQYISANNSHQALRVTIVLRHGSPIREPQHLFHLDALLAHVRVAESMKRGAEDYSAQENLPLAKLSNNSDFVWAASAFHYDTHFREQRYWSRRTNVDSLAKAQGEGLITSRADKLNTGSGPWKGYSEFEKLIHTNLLTAWCIGDKDEITELLSKVTHIGKRRSKGYGEIDSFTVEVDEMAHQKVFSRVLTWPHSDDYAPVKCGVRPPYFETRFGYYPNKSVMQLN